jgi:glycosyltransferase involved in cell wall biosynthesis
MTDANDRPNLVKIAVDCSFFAGPTQGLSRYLRALLPRLIAISPENVRWLLYTRHGTSLPCMEEHRRVIVRRDKLPSDSGRLLSLFSSMPAWAYHDKPSVFWAPAHRAPLWLPRGTRSVLTVHDLAWAEVPQTMRRSTRIIDKWFMNRSVQRADFLISVSHATAASLERWLPSSAQRTRVIYPAAEALPIPGDLALVAPGLKRGHYILFVGTPEPRKNLPRLLEGYALARQQNPNVPALVLAGGNGWGQQPTAIIDQQALRPFVHSLGKVSDQHLSTLYANALCLALPSLYEGFGLPLVEAMAAGLPIITSNSSSMREVAGPAALLVDPLSATDIANALLRISEDRLLHATLAAVARQQAPRYSWDTAAAATLEVLLDASASA